MPNLPFVSSKIRKEKGKTHRKTSPRRFLGPLAQTTRSSDMFGVPSEAIDGFLAPLKPYEVEESVRNFLADYLDLQQGKDPNQKADYYHNLGSATWVRHHYKTDSWREIPMSQLFATLFSVDVQDFPQEYWVQRELGDVQMGFELNVDREPLNKMFADFLVREVGLERANKMRKDYEIDSSMLIAEEVVAVKVIIESTNLASSLRSVLKIIFLGVSDRCVASIELDLKASHCILRLTVEGSQLSHELQLAYSKQSRVAVMWKLGVYELPTSANETKSRKSFVEGCSMYHEEGQCLSESQKSIVEWREFQRQRVNVLEHFLRIRA